MASIEAVFKLAKEVFGDKAVGYEWILENKKNKIRLQTENGRKELLNILTQIRYGIY